MMILMYTSLPALRSGNLLIPKSLKDFPRLASLFALSAGLTASLTNFRQTTLFLSALLLPITGTISHETDVFQFDSKIAGYRSSALPPLDLTNLKAALRPKMRITKHGSIIRVFGKRSTVSVTYNHVTISRCLETTL